MKIYKYKDFLIINELEGKRIVKVSINNNYYNLDDVNSDDLESNIREISKRLDQTILKIKQKVTNKSDKYYIVQAMVLLLIDNKRKTDFGKFKDFADFKNSLGELRKRLSLFEAISTAVQPSSDKKTKTIKEIYDNVNVGGNVYQVIVDNRNNTKTYEKVMDLLYNQFKKVYKKPETILIRSYIELYLIIEKN